MTEIRLQLLTDFESVHQLQFIKHSYLRTSRILLHLLEGFGTISLIHIELEHLSENMARLHAIFTICHPSYSSIWAYMYVMHVTLDPRLPLFSRKDGESREETRDRKY